MAIEGNLAHVGLADICQLLAMGRKTGCLTVSNRPAYGNVYFDRGRVCFARVVNRPDRLGSLLVANGLVTEAELDAAVEAQAGTPDKRLGEILVESGALSQEDLERYVSLQIEEAVYHLFGWTEGTFRFEPDEVPDESEAMLVSINTEGLLLEGARRVDEWSLIEKKIPSMDLIFSVEHLPDDEDDVEITESQQKVLQLLDGERTVDDVVDASGMVEFDVAKALFGLLQAGFIEQTGQRKREPAPPTGGESSGLAPAFYRSGLLDDAVRELSQAVERDPGDQESRFRLGVALLKLGRFQDALDQLDAVGAPLSGGAGLRRNRALALEHLGRFDEARTLLQELVQEDPTRLDAQLALAVVRLKSGDVPGASRALKRVYEATAGVAPALLYGCAILASALEGDLRAAVEWGEEGLEHYPDEPVLMVNLGAVQERRGLADEAEALYLRAVATSDTLPQAHKNLGDLAFERNDLAGARAHYERAVKLAPRLGDDVYQKLGAIAQREDDADWARMLWQRALELNPENEAARSAIARLDSA